MSLGFKYITKGSTANWKKFKNPKDGCTYISGQPRGKDWLYKNSNEDNSWKNIFDFQRTYNHEVINFQGTAKQKDYFIIQHLNQYLDPSQQLLNNQNEIILKFKKKIVQQKKLAESSEFNKTELYDFTYLVEQRKIAKSTIEHPLVKGTVFNTIFKLKSGKHKVNTGFAKYDIENNIKAMEVYYEGVNTSSSLVLSSKKEAHYDTFLWRTNTPKDKPLSHVYYAESAKDAVSYLEVLLSRNVSKMESFNPLFISIGGNLDGNNRKKNQINTLLESYILAKETRFISIADNDKAGNKYDIHFLETTNNLLNSSKINVTETGAFLEVTFDNITKELKESVTKLNNDVTEILKPSDNFGKFFILKEKENKILIPADTTKYDYHLKFINEFNNIQFKDFKIDKFISQKPTDKGLNGDLDWNAFLMYKKAPTYFLERQNRHLNYKIQKKSRVNNTPEKKNEYNYEMTR